MAKKPHDTHCFLFCVVRSTIMLELAKQVIEEFEKYDPIPTTKEEWRNDVEFIAMYVAALKYVELFG